jgi:hypothetical protein
MSLSLKLNTDAISTDSIQISCAHSFSAYSVRQRRRAMVLVLAVRRSLSQETRHLVEQLPQSRDENDDADKEKKKKKKKKKSSRKRPSLLFCFESI